MITPRLATVETANILTNAPAPNVILRASATAIVWGAHTTKKKKKTDIEDTRDD